MQGFGFRESCIIRVEGLGVWGKGLRDHLDRLRALDLGFDEGSASRDDK